MTAPATIIKQAQDLIRERIMEKLREDPNAYGRVSVEVVFQDGKATTIQTTSTATTKP